MSDPPDNPPHNAETVADTGPRWTYFSVASIGDLIFLGRAGPIDVWADSGDHTGVPFHVRRESSGFWSQSPEFIILRCRDQCIHLTLHDECSVHQLCEAHNTNHNGDTQ